MDAEVKEEKIYIGCI